MADPRLAQLPTIYDAIRLGVVDFEIAALGTAYDSDASYERLGTIVPGTYKQEIGRETYKVERGLPKIASKAFAIGMNGKVAMDLGEITPRAIEVQNGGLAPVVTSTSATTTTVAAATTTSFTLTSAVGYAVGKWISVVVGSSTIYRKITGLNGAVVTVDPLPAAPASGAAVAVITSIQVAGGGTKVVERTARAIFVDTYGDKFIWYFPKVISTGNMNFDPKDGASEAILPMEFDLYGVQATVAGETDYFLYHSHFVPKP